MVALFTLIFLKYSAVRVFDLFSLYPAVTTYQLITSIAIYTHFLLMVKCLAQRINAIAYSFLTEKIALVASQAVTLFIELLTINVNQFLNSLLST